MRLSQLSLILGIVGIATLSGCSSKPTSQSAAGSQRPMVSGTVGGGAAGSTQIGHSSAMGGASSATSGNVLSRRVVHFDFDSSQILSKDVSTLTAHANFLAQNPSARVTLEGHTDERGTREYNMALGERRANSVLDFLVSNGANSGQLDRVSFGKEQPVNPASNESAWAENRRVELRYTATPPAP